MWAHTFLSCSQSWEKGGLIFLARGVVQGGASEKGASFQVRGWRAWDNQLNDLSPAQNKDGAPSSPACLLNQRNHPPLQLEWALGGWTHLHNILKRGN